MLNPKVTIGVCVRNCQDTLGKAIESIMAQDCPHELMEVIFVDDGSEDGTLSIIERYVVKMDMQVKIFHHEWKGLGYSRNVVVNNAKGDYIIWVDGDLMLTSNYVSTMLEFMEKNPKVAIAGGSYGMLVQRSLVAFLDNVEYVAYRYKSGTNLPGTGGAIYRVKAIKEIGGFDEKIKGSCEDIDVAYRIISAGWSVVRDKALFFAYSKKTWKECWNHLVWHGYGAHYIKHKHNQILLLSRFSPLASLIGGVVYAVTAYKIIRRKPVFLLPLYTLFKNLAWWLGFLKSHIKGYGHGKIKGIIKEN
jgi:glycosyltransferase involved in cell wall biosynthesis